MQTRICLFLLVLICASLAHAVPLGTAFTYQGELKQFGVAATGSFDFQFELYALDLGGIAIAAPVLLEDVPVVDGVFTVELDFGSVPFAGDQLWLEVGVREGTSTGGYTGLLPRQKVTPVPYALHAEFVAMSSVGIDEVDSTQVQLRVDDNCAIGSAIRAIDVTGTVTCENDDVGLTVVTGTDIQDGTVKAVDVDTTEVQARIDEACSPGTAIRGIGVDGTVTCEPVNPPSLIVNLTASPENLIGPGDVTLSWTTQFVSSCTPTGGAGTSWDTTNITLPNGQTTITGVSADTTFALTCDVVDSVDVTVDDPWGGFPPPGDCAPGEQPPPGTNHENPLEVVAGPTNRLAVTNNFEGPFGEGWPGVPNSKEDIYIGQDNWIALGFIAAQASNCTGTDCDRTTGRVEWESSILSDGPKVVSISRCPGDFNTTLGTCRVDRSPLRWAYDSGSTCVLTQGQQYYLNVIHGTSADPSVSTCATSECGAFLNVR